MLDWTMAMNDNSERQSEDMMALNAKLTNGFECQAN